MRRAPHGGGRRRQRRLGDARRPLCIVKRGYRKLAQIPTPKGAQHPWDNRPPASQRALGLAERWRRMPDSGEVGSINELAMIAIWSAQRLRLEYFVRYDGY